MPQLPTSFFGDLSSSVSSIFAGLGAETDANLKGEGLDITAMGTREQAAGTRISAEGTELSAESLRIKAGGDIAEASNYDLAAGLAREQEAFTGVSTRLQTSQLSRSLTMTIGGVQAAAGGAGFTSGGSAGDIMRDSATQGALARSTLEMQGAITEAGFEEQAKSFDTMAAAGRATAAGETDIAAKTDTIAGEQRGLADQQDMIAAAQNKLASDTRAAGKQAATMDFISGALKGVGAVASIFLA